MLGQKKEEWETPSEPESVPIPEPDPVRTPTPTPPPAPVKVATKNFECQVRLGNQEDFLRLPTEARERLNDPSKGKPNMMATPEIEKFVNRLKEHIIDILMRNEDERTKQML